MSASKPSPPHVLLKKLREYLKLINALPDVQGNFYLRLGPDGQIDPQPPPSEFVTNKETP